METDEIDLAKVTETDNKIAALLQLEKITVADLHNFSIPERRYAAAVFTKVLEELKDRERDDFIDKIDLIVPPTTKDQLWEHNHQVIAAAISKLMQKHGCMPAKSHLALETGLSRQTIVKHLKEYKSHPEYTAEIEQFRFMTSKLAAKVFTFAVNGDMKAARLYLEMVGAISKRQGNAVINEQNNYIQINNTILSQENLRCLSAEQLNQIENIITMGLPERQKLNKMAPGQC